VHANIAGHLIPFNAEADSLNCKAILAPDVTPTTRNSISCQGGGAMTVKAGQKCTAIRRAIVPRARSPRWPSGCATAWPNRGRRPVERHRAHGRAGSHAQAKDGPTRGRAHARRRGGIRPKTASTPSASAAEGAFFAPTLLLAKRAMSHAAHDVEAFGPVSTLMPYDTLDEAVALAARGRGSLVGTLVTKDPPRRAVVPQSPAWHGRLLALDREAAVEPPATAARRRAETRRPAAPAAHEELGGAAR
jgi:oxepin-CoA hydrolase/3-oxo-5,6-dehydrosuberyl-CoA semialdehyde dehydrogenase